MLKLALFVSFSFLFGCGQNVQQVSGDQADSIVGGREVPTNHIISSYTVAILDMKANGLCTGTIISKNHILTAAHCVPNGAESLVVVFSNQVKNLKAVSAAKIYKVAAAYAHMDYGRSSDGLNNSDIAVIKIRGSLPAGYQPVKFAKNLSRYPHEKPNLVAAGYGISNRVLKSGAGVLRTTPVHFSDILSFQEFVTKQIKSGVCMGDSGGPVFEVSNGQHYLAGVTSRGTKIGLNCMGYGIFTRVDHFEHWIEAKMHGYY